MTILDHIDPRYTPRDVQVDILNEIEATWDEYDFFLIDAPVASGKSLIATTIANWRKSKEESSGILTPRNNLQDQYQGDFPDIPSLKGKHKYECHKSEVFNSCGDYQDAFGHYCCGGNCNYVKNAKESDESHISILNFHSHLFRGMALDNYKYNLIIDEAHNLIQMLSDAYTTKIWKHLDKYPKSRTKDDITVFLDTKIREFRQRWEEVKEYHSGEIPADQLAALSKEKRKMDGWERTMKGLMECKEEFHVSVKKGPYRGRIKEYLEIQPISLRRVRHAMWPKTKVRKVVLLSATMYKTDLERLGVAPNRIKVIQCDSPIPKDNRPIVVAPVAFMSYNNREMACKIMAGRIEELADFHKGKGIVHITYSLAQEFKKHLTDKRYMWHTSENKDKVYQRFLKSKQPKILMACGMGEGIDLAGKDYEWQVIAKVPFPSLGDPFIRHVKEISPEVYARDTVRAVVQQSGRNCRTPTDFGVTYILDGFFARLFKNNKTMFPGYFREALHWEK